MKTLRIKIETKTYQVTALTSAAMGFLTGALCFNYHTDEEVYKYAIEHPERFIVSRAI